MKNHYDNYYLQFRGGYQKNFLKAVKQSHFNSWESVATFLGINRSMVFLYLSESSKLPLSSFKKLVEVSNINPKESSFEIVPYIASGIASIPNTMTPELAEFVGIMLGDGNINSKTYQITISCGEIDGAYIKDYIPNLVNLLFSKRVSFRKITVGGIDGRFCSKKVAEYLTKEMGITSPKIGCSIPRFFFKDASILRACVRGLFDTDGGLHQHHLHSAQLHFTNKSLLLIKSLKEALEQLGFKPSKICLNNRKKKTYLIYLFDKDVKKYFQEIGSSNPKNKIKFRRWIEEGKVPLNKEIIQWIQ